jgi:DNA-binding response OmpR family regulator
LLHLRPAIILLVEHNKRLRRLVHDVLEFAGWYVKDSDAIYARSLLECREHFDLLVIDNDSCYSGLELIKLMRRLPQRRQTPIILISLEDLTKEAREAGADVFLRKPNCLRELANTIRRLLNETHAV